ncbi:XdhC family protein [Stutzerimonas stutzeri]|uniref:XdhC family protein n=1 Tax=Stutzerimonas stutzeri TaxID=316 RepID=A0A6I6LNS3_STUST|nr:XdhC family protein [Stutzerimonas stutzeri]QGZ30427.1 XdhC family protein [Stutzerimonas stutzeri]
MKSLDLQVVRQAIDWLDAGHDIWLCTVLATYGSAPRSPGAMLVVLRDGRLRGSLSGGCVEEDFIQRLGEGQFDRARQVVRYGEGGLAPTLVLPCGGVLDVLVERLTPGCEASEQLALMEQALLGQRQLVRIVPLGAGATAVDTVGTPTPRIQRDDDEIRIRIGAAQRLLIAGISPVASFCAQFALALGYEVIVCDPRTELHESLRVPGVELRKQLPALYIADGGCHERTAVVALTHDPRLDDLTVMEAVRTPAFYIGVMGSRRTSEKRMERLRRIGGLGPTELARVHAPIGLALGSRTPAEIALSVMADILRASNAVPRDRL